jgi:hypothetical protein
LGRLPASRSEQPEREQKIHTRDLRECTTEEEGVGCGGRI